MNVSEAMYLPLPIPLEREYPVILNSWDPFAVSILAVEVVTDEQEGEVVGLEGSTQTLEIPILYLIGTSGQARNEGVRV